MAEDPDAIRQEIARTRERMDDAVEELKGRADIPTRVKHAVSGQIETVKGTISGTAGGAAHAARDAVDRLGESASAISIGARPVTVALGALFAGLVVGLVVPTSRFERERIGPMRDNLLDRAQAAGKDAITLAAETALGLTPSRRTAGENQRPTG